MGHIGGEDTRTCNEDCRKGAREEIVEYGESGQDVIWFYARQRNDRYSVPFFGGYKRSTYTRRRSCRCASLTWRRHLTGSSERYWSGQRGREVYQWQKVRPVMSLYESANTRQSWARYV